VKSVGEYFVEGSVDGDIRAGDRHIAVPARLRLVDEIDMETSQQALGQRLSLWEKGAPRFKVIEYRKWEGLQLGLVSYPITLSIYPIKPKKKAAKKK
jgi:hypothetical protein